MGIARDYRGLQSPGSGTRCPECGALRRLSDGQCWLCYAQPPTASAIQPRSTGPFGPRDAQPVSESSQTALRIARGVIVGLVVLAIAASFSENLRAGGVATIIGAVLLAYLLRPADANETEGQALLSRLGKMAFAVTAVAGLLATVAVAVFIAFFAYCLYAIGGGFGH